MASLRQHPRSPYWFACFTLPDGRRTQRSTGVPVAGVRPADLAPLKRALKDTIGAEVELSVPATDSSGALGAREARRLAQRIAAEFEEAGREARAKRLTEHRARSVIADLFAMSNDERLPGSTVKGFLDGWLRRKELEAGETTHARYATVVADLLEFLGPRAGRELAHLSAKEITAFRDHLAKRLTPGTVNVSLKIIRSAMAQARRDGLVDVNEAERVTLLKNGRAFERRPFTLPELRRVLDAANEEWRGMILVGLYTGLRLSDVATLTWSNVDLQAGELAVTTGKTGRRQVLPLAKPLLRHLEGLPAGDNPEAPLFPEAYAARQRSQYGGTLSNQFRGVLVSAGLAKARSHISTGKGRDARRTLGGLSFHCLRHTATSLLKNAGVSDAVARDIIGHESAAVSQQYTHVDADTKRRAMATMPDVTASAEVE